VSNKKNFIHLLSASEVPEHRSKHYGYESCEEKPHGSVWWITPIRPTLFPQASLALDQEGLRELSREMKIL